MDDVDPNALVLELVTVEMGGAYFTESNHKLLFNPRPAWIPRFVWLWLIRVLLHTETLERVYRY